MIFHVPGMVVQRRCVSYRTARLTFGVHKCTRVPIDNTESAILVYRKAEGSIGNFSALTCHLRVRAYASVCAKNGKAMSSYAAQLSAYPPGLILAVQISKERDIGDKGSPCPSVSRTAESVLMCFGSGF